VDLAAHSLHSDCAPVEGDSPQKPAPPGGKGKKSLADAAGAGIAEPGECSGFNLRRLDAVGSGAVGVDLAALGGGRRKRPLAGPILLDGGLLLAS
jgi:hypothetical protein